jgi:hypothetical protein
MVRRDQTTDLEGNMATFSEAFAKLDDYRLALLSEQQTENTEAASEAFAARGAFSAFATPLTNVHATGVGIRVRDGKIVDGDFVIKVYVFDKQDLGRNTPAITQGQFDGVGIDVEHLPVQQALATRRMTTTIEAGTTPAQHQARHRPVIGGLQISPLGANFVGTLGCLVRRGTQVFVLSNNHVVADTNRLPIGKEIVQTFGMAPADVFARLADFETIRFPQPGGATPRNRMDAAIAAVTAPNLVRIGTMFGIPNYTPQLLAPRPAMAVTKSGRTTGVTSGRITAIRVNGVTVNYGTVQNPVIGTFDNCVQISAPAGVSFSRPGDSGSAILDEATGRPVALLFAGNGTSTTACDLTAVCTRFNVVPV